MQVSFIVYSEYSHLHIPNILNIPEKNKKLKLKVLKLLEEVLNKECRIFII